MKEFACRKCGSAELFIKENGTQVGLYCSDCGAWQKWLSKDEQRLAQQWIDNLKSGTSKVDNNDTLNNKIGNASKELINILKTYYDEDTFIVIRQDRVDICKGVVNI